MPGNNNNLNVGVLPNRFLGDGIVYLVFAKNLARNGFSVTYYNDYLRELDEWLPDLAIRSRPADEEELTEAILRHDLMAADPAAIEGMTIEESTRRKVVEFLPTKKEFHDDSDTTPEWVWDNARGENIINRLGGRRFVIYTERDRDRTMVECCVDICQKVLGLEDSSANVEFLIPAGLTKHRYSDRIVVFPTTPLKKKEYPAGRYVTLLHKLKREGWNPVVAVLPHELETWQEQGLPFEVKTFSGVSEMTGYLYESALVITNDSGGGHLASAFGVPTVTLYANRKPFPWRPGWAPGYVARPQMILRFGGRKIWSPFISQREILKQIRKLTAHE